MNKYIHFLYLENDYIYDKNITLPDKEEIENILIFFPTCPCVSPIILFGLNWRASPKSPIHAVISDLISTFFDLSPCNKIHFLEKFKYKNNKSIKGPVSNSGFGSQAFHRRNFFMKISKSSRHRIRNSERKKIIFFEIKKFQSKKTCTSLPRARGPPFPGDRVRFQIVAEWASLMESSHQPKFQLFEKII